MKIKNILMWVGLAAIAVALLGVSKLGLKTPFGTRTLAQQVQAQPGTLRWYAQQASTRGRTSITLSVSPNYLGPSSLNDATSAYSTVVAQLLGRDIEFNENDNAITTWYKFRIFETLSQKSFIPCTGCTASQAPPASLLPLQSGEVLVPLVGGSTMIENVVVERKLQGFPGFIDGQTYLLFLNLDTTCSIGTLDFGPRGAMVVTASNTLTPVVDLLPGDDDPVSVDLANQYGSSLAQLRAAINPPPPPPPSTCDPDGSQRQSCISRGGVWYAEDCFCEVDICLRKPWLCE